MFFGRIILKKQLNNYIFKLEQKIKLIMKSLWILI